MLNLLCLGNMRADSRTKFIMAWLVSRVFTKNAPIGDNFSANVFSSTFSKSSSFQNG